MTDLQTLVKAVGYLGVGGIIFAESGLLVGFFLPGDSLLFTAGFLASQGYLDIAVLLFLTFLAAVIGNSLGYYFGWKFGPAIFVRQRSVLFNRKYVTQAERFFETHGARTVILSRFVPIVRTFVPIVAGVGKMSFNKFTVYNLIGGFLWTWGLLFLGFYLGGTIPNIDEYILPIIAGVFILSVIPGIVKISKNEELRSAIKAMFRK